MILLIEARISSIDGSRCALLAVAIVTSAAPGARFASQPLLCPNHETSVTDQRPSENPQCRTRSNFNRLPSESAAKGSSRRTKIPLTAGHQGHKVPHQTHDGERKPFAVIAQYSIFTGI
jgi:hypothetical protein